MQQMTFRDVEIGEKQARVKVLATYIQRRLKAAALSIDRHTFAAINDKSYSYISDIVNTNNEDGSKPFPVNFIPAEIIEAPDVFMKEVWNPIAELCGHQPSPGKKSPLSAEEELKELKAKIRAHGLEKVFDESVRA